MSLIADAFQPKLISALFDISGRSTHCHIPDVLIDSKSAYDLNFDAASKSVSIDFREPNYIGSVFCGDACRFASAAFSSALTVENKFSDQNHFPWAIVRMYYAAFYAGHAVIRLLGTSCSFLYGSHTGRIVRVATAIGSPPPFPLNSGLYKCDLLASQTGFQFAQAGGRVGGAHETFWLIFEEFISSLTEEVISGHLAPNDARNVFIKLESYRFLLNKAGPGGGWLSSVRNEVQYRHGHDAWLPSSIRTRGREVLCRIALQWQRNPMDIDIDAPHGADLGQFFAAAAFSVALCRELLSRVADRSSAGRRSFAYVPLGLCRDTEPEKV